MAKHTNGTSNAEGSTKLAKKTAPRSLAIANKGVHTATQFAALMSSLMSDLIDGSIPPNVGNATCNAGGKLLRIVELQYKYGTTTTDGKSKTLRLTVSEDQPVS